MDYTIETIVIMDYTIDIINGKNHYKKGTKPLVDAPKCHTQGSANLVGKPTRSASL